MLDQKVKATWRSVFPGDERQAQDLNFALFMQAPTRDVNGDPMKEVYEENLRAELPEVVAQLDRNSLITVYRVSRLLALFPLKYGDQKSEGQTWD